MYNVQRQLKDKGTMYNVQRDKGLIFKNRLHLIINRARERAIFLYISKNIRNFARFLV